MTAHDIYLLSPEISVAALAVIVLLLDLVIVRKGYLAAISILGLAVPLGFSLSLWFNTTASSSVYKVHSIARFEATKMGAVGLSADSKGDITFIVQDDGGLSNGIDAPKKLKLSRRPSHRSRASCWSSALRLEELLALQGPPLMERAPQPALQERRPHHPATSSPSTSR